MSTIEAENKMYDEMIATIRKTVSMEPKIGIICGSGLGGITDILTNTTSIKYENIPGWPKATVKGHAGELVFGKIEGTVDVVCMKGRFHGYEGHESSKLGLGVRVMKLLGIKLIVVTNAAGGLNVDFNVGDFMVLNDHVSIPCLAGLNPLVGLNNERFGTRFPAMSDAYDENLIDHVFACADKLGISQWMREGSYAHVSGPTYESRGESLLIRAIGADAVGMSTVPEVMVAKHCGLKIIGMSMITNKAVLPGDNTPPANHAEVIEVVDSRNKYVLELVKLVCKDALDVMSGAKPVKPRTKTKAANLPTYLAPVGVCVAALVAFGIFKNLK